MVDPDDFERAARLGKADTVIIRAGTENGVSETATLTLTAKSAVVTN